jgi:ribosomal protein S18 acetylase RimI-like enzyme|tara:strand:+ start:288 stop:869 length:582 start_codon:yes stop_codon:yes gene_type:complete
MDTPQVNKIELRDHDAIKAAVTLGFASDPLLRFFFDAPHKYLRSFSEFMNEFLSLSIPAGGAFADNNFSGGSIWLPPGVHLDDEQLSHTFSDIPEERLETVLAILAKFSEYHPEEDHWYLAFIGVDPSKQGQGLGSLILKEALKKVDEDGLVAYLESSNPMNMSLYERHGFETMGRVEINGSPPVHPMIRQPR